MQVKLSYCCTTLLSGNSLPDVSLSSDIQCLEEQLYLLRRLSCENEQKTFVLFDRCLLNSHVIPFCCVDDIVLVEIVDKSRGHRIQVLQQEDVVFTNPCRTFNTRVATFHVNISDKIFSVLSIIIYTVSQKRDPDITDCTCSFKKD